MVKNNSSKNILNEKLNQLEKEYSDLSKKYREDISYNYKAYIGKKIKKVDYKSNSKKITDKFNEEKNRINSEKLKAKNDYKNCIKIKRLENENNSFQSNIKSLEEVNQTLNNQSEKIQIINCKTYKEKKSVIAKISRNTSKLNKLLAKYTKNKYDIYQLELMSEALNNNDADKLYQFICYVEQNNSKDSKIFPYKLNSLTKLNIYTRKLLLLTTKLIWFKDIRLRSLILEHSSTYWMRKKVKKLETKIKNFENDIKNLKVGFADRYHAYLVDKLTKAKKDKNYEANQKIIADKKEATKVRSKNKLEQLNKEYLSLLNKYRKDILDNYKAYTKKKINKVDYKFNKAKIKDAFYEEEDRIRSEKIKAKYDYKNFSDFDNQPYAVELKNVVKYYNNKVLATKVLSNVNLKIKKGEFVVILGPSGSGKTTLLNIISGMDNASYGDTIVAGENLIDYSPSKLTLFRRNNIGYVFQQYGLLPNLTVKENIQIGQNLQDNKSKIIPIDEILKAIGLETQENKYPNELSGGQQQRVSIARSVAKNPNILFGDEPTGAIDEEMSKNIMNLFVEINKKYHTTIIIVTHNPILAEIATMVINVANGTISNIKINKNPKSVEELNWTNKTDKKNK